MAPTEHIPAWKRLGLKLKSAPVGKQENLEPIAGEQLPNRASTPEVNTKRQRDQSSDTNEGPPSKKSKHVKPFKSALSPPPDFQSPALRKQKSVSFTPETKKDDGDSIKQLFNAWVDQQKQEDPTFATRRSIAAFQTPEPPEVIEKVEDKKLNETEKRIKRVEKPAKVKKPEKIKKVKESIKPSAPAAPVRLSPALSYLREYHDSRATWKFNKNHQNFIIKHIFDISHIPLDHTNLLHHYITGMQGNVRTRLRDEALKVKIQDQEAGIEAFPSGMADAIKKQQEYIGAMAEYVATINMGETNPPIGYEEGIAMQVSDPAMRQRLGKRMRAERVLVQLSREPSNGEFANGNEKTSSGNVAGDADSQKRLRLNDGSSQKKARSRKVRTAVEVNGDDETSSSGSSDSEEESSSDSSSSSDSDDDSEEGGVAVTRGAGNVEESSSSSSSSSSSEGEDSDSDSEEEEGDD